MEIDAIKNGFFYAIEQINLIKTATRFDSQSKRKNLASLCDELKLTNRSIDEPHYCWEQMISYKLNNGEHFRYGMRSQSFGDAITQSWLHENRQYQWMLAEAYEIFEDLIIDLFVFSVLKDPQLWGDLKLTYPSRKNIPDVPGKEQLNDEWIRGNIEKLPSKVTNFLDIFRKKNPTIQQIEDTNFYNINVKLVIVMLAQFRHKIVHARGKIIDPELFIKKIEDQSSLTKIQKKKFAYPSADLVKSFIGKISNKANNEDTSFCILLVDQPSDIDYGLPITRSRLEFAIHILVSYADALIELIKFPTSDQ